MTMKEMLLNRKKNIVSSILFLISGLIVFVALSFNQIKQRAEVLGMEASTDIGNGYELISIDSESFLEVSKFFLAVSSFFIICVLVSAATLVVLGLIKAFLALKASSQCESLDVKTDIMGRNIIMTISSGSVLIFMFFIQNI